VSLTSIFAKPENSNQKVENRFESVGATERSDISDLVNKIKAKLGVTRDAHAKAHGCVADVKVTVAIDPKIDESVRKKLQVGFFSEEGKVYSAIARISPGAGNPKAPDQEGGPQGFALKLLLDKKDQEQLVPVFGENQLFVDEKYYRTFDIITISHLREFFVNHIQDYPVFTAGQEAAGEAGKTAFLEAIKAGKSPTEAGALAKGAGFAALAKAYFIIDGKEARKKEKALLLHVSAQRPKNPLLETYNSWVPSLLGDEAIKYEIAPCETAVPSDYVVPAEIDSAKDPNFLSKVIQYELAQKSHCYQLKIQLHQEGFPSVEEAVEPWPVDQSPYIKIATIEIPKKVEAGKALLDKNLCEAMSFHPGHASEAHYPLGGIQRARIGGKDAKGEFEGIYTAIHRERNLNAQK